MLTIVLFIINLYKIKSPPFVISDTHIMLHGTIFNKNISQKIYEHYYVSRFNNQNLITFSF